MSNNDLAALSEAATQALERAMVLADADCDPETMRQARHENTAAHDRLAFALVNEYRAGRLVQIDEGMREATARAEAAEAIADDVHKALWAAEARNKVLEEALRALITEREGHFSTQAAWDAARQALGAEHGK